MVSPSLEFWQSQSHYYDEAFRTTLDKSVQFVTVGLTVLVTGIAGLFASSNSALLLAIPPVLFVLWTVALRVLHESLYLAVHRDIAEQEVGTIVRNGGGEYQPWHLLGGRHSRIGLPNTLMYVTLALTSAGIFITSMALAYTYAPAVRGWVIAESVLIVTFLAAAVTAAVLMNRRLGRDYDTHVFKYTP